MREMMEENYAKAEANRKTDREELKANQAKMDADRIADKNERKAEMETNQGKMERQIGSLVSKMDTNLARMDAIVRSIRYEPEETIQRRSENVTERQEIPEEGAAVASLEQGPKEVESGSERREVPKKEVAVNSSRTTKKRPRGRRTDAGRRVKPTKLTRGDGESRKKLVAACRKVSCRAAVAWRKRNLSRKIRIQVNCGPRQKLDPSRMIMNFCTGVAQRKEQGRKRQTRNQVERETQKRLKNETRLWKYPRAINGIGDRGLRQQLLGNRRIKGLGGTWPRFVLKERKTTDGIRGNTAKQIAGFYFASRRIKDWTMWRGRPPPKRWKREPHA
jgi:hypothetical protein